MTFKLTLRPGGYQLWLQPGETLLQGALRLGYQVPYGCRNGICGACQAQLISGKVRYPAGASLQVQQALEQGIVYCCQARLESDVELDWQPVIAPKASALTRYHADLLDLSELSGGVWRVRLQLQWHGQQQPDFIAGQYLQLILKDGSKRPFSIASGPSLPWIELHIRHRPGNNWTGQVIQELQQYHQVQLELPLGEAYWRATGRQVLFLAGGTGFAPIKSMLDELSQSLAKVPVLYWGAVELDGLYLYQQALVWHQQQRLKLVACLDKPPLDWAGFEGSALSALLEDWPDLSDCDLYVAGRDELVWAAYSACLQQGLPKERFFSDTVDLALQANN